MATDNPRGFVPSRHLTGRAGFAHNQYRVSANNPTRIFVGDPVFLNSDGKVRVIDTSAMSANERACLGIVRSLYNSDGRPLTHNLPATGQVIAASTQAFVDVCDDPDTIFLVQADSAISQGDVGNFVRVTAGPANTALGRSGFQVRSVDSTVSAVGHHFLINGVAPLEKINGLGDTAFSANQDVEVIIVNHHFRRQWQRVGTEVGD